MNATLITELTGQDILALMDYVERTRTYMEKRELYEACAEMRDFKTLLDDLLLGYVTREDVEGTILLFLMSDPDTELTYINPELQTVCWRIPTGQTIAYVMDTETLKTIRAEYGK